MGVVCYVYSGGWEMPGREGEEREMRWEVEEGGMR